jgi:flagellar biosynthetic protein FliR
MNVSLPWVAHLLFITIRLSALFLFTPIQAIRQLPAPMRLILVFSFSLLVHLNTPAPASTDYLFARSLAEFANGLILATSLYAAFSIYQIAGQLIDNQTGLNSLTLFKPDEPGQEPLTSRLLSMLAVLLFFGSHGYLWLFKGLSYSFVISPPGALVLLNGLNPIMKQFGFMFSMSFIMASPIVIALMTIDFCSALITRTMPQVNTYFFTLPLKIILGLIILILMLQYIAPLTDLIMEECFHTWQEVMS